MANEIVSNLFGLDPTMFQAQREAADEAKAFQMAQLQPGQAAKAAAYGMVNSFGRGLNSLLGVEDPELAANNKLLAVKKQFIQSGGDPRTPEGMAQFAQMLNEQGLSEQAMKAQDKAMMMAKAQSEVGKNQAAAYQSATQATENLAGAKLKEAQTVEASNKVAKLSPEKFTPESLQEFINGGAKDYSVLKPVGKGWDVGSKVEVQGSVYVYDPAAYAKAAPGTQGPIEGLVRVGAPVDRSTNVSVTNTGQITKFDKLGGLRETFLQETKPHRDLMSMTSKIEAALKQATALGDNLTPKGLAKIFADSSISKEEAAQFRNFGSIGERLAGSVERFIDGKYTPNQREEALSMLKALREPSEKAYNKAKTETRRMAKVEQLTDEQVEFLAPDFEVGAAPTPPSNKPSVNDLLAKYGKK